MRDFLCPIVAREEAEQERFRQLFPQYAPLLGLKWSTEEETLTERTRPTEKIPPAPDQRPNRYRYFWWTILAAALTGALIWTFFEQPAPEVVPPKIPETPNIVGCMDSTALNFDSTATEPCANCCRYEQVQEEQTRPRETISTLAQRDTLSAKPPFDRIVAHALPPLDPIPEDGLTWLSDYKRPVSLVLWGLLFVLSLGYYLWRRAERKYLARQNRSDEPPYRLPIKIRREQPIALSDEFFLAINRLRGRELGERRKLDMRKTVAATLRRGGFANFQYRTLTRPVEYLILIDKQAEQNHQAQLFEYIYQEVTRQEVYAERYFFDGDPRYCWNDQHPAGVSLERLLQKHNTARLLVLADGYSFINPASGELEDWVKALGGWEQRALLSPSPTAGWNFREALLARFFLVLPANVQGLTQVVRHFEALPTPSLRDWKYDIGKEDIPFRLDQEHVVTSLRGVLSSGLMRWLTACAVYPELHWDLTLELGEALSEPDEKLVRFENVTQLARLPWFRDGYMPAAVREQLLESDYLSDADRLAVRAAIVRILEANTPTHTGSYAFEEHQLHLAINNILLSRLPEEQQEWIRRYRELHAKGVREDQVSMVELDRHFNTLLDFPLPQTFFPKGRRLLGWRSGVPILLAALLAVVVWALGLLIPDPCGGTVAPLPYGEERYCLQSPEDSLAFFAHEAARRADSLHLDELLQHIDVVADLQLDTFNLALKDSLYYAPVEARLWNLALAAYHADEFDKASAIAGKMKELLEAEANYRIAQDPGSTNILDDQGQLKWRYYWQCMELLGRAAFFAENREVAEQLAGQVIQGGGYTDLLSPPHLRTLLDYDFVDSMQMGYIRIRQGNKYGFLDRQGNPSWNGREPPYDYALNFRIEEDGIKALVTIATRQCYITREGKIGDCFDRLIRYQDSLTGEFGYENELGFPVIPAQYVEAGEFTADDLAWVKRPEDEGYGYIRFDNSRLLPENNLEEPGDFREGLAVVKLNGRYGYLNAQGNMAIDPIFDAAGDFTAGGRATVQRARRSYTIDRNGRCVAGDCPVLPYQIQIGGASGNKEGNQGPIAGVRVRITGYDGTWITDQNGMVDFELPENIRINTVSISLNKDGFQPTSFQPKVFDATTDPIALETFIDFPEMIPDDGDGDGVPDNIDKCPDVAGTAELEGCPPCPDTDQDGICNENDDCPDRAGPESNQGCPVVELIVPEMITIPGGPFTMGCLDGRDTDCDGDESPAHEVTVPTFGMGKYEVTVREYLAFADATNGNYPEWLETGNDNHIETGTDTYYKDLGYSREAGNLPVVGVSWNNAVAYCQWLSEQTGESYRLPSEAEWEYAVRGGAKSQGYLYAGSNDVETVAWYSSNSDGRTHPVGLKRPNELGLYDMSGNVYEWCADDWHSDYNGAPVDGSAWIDSDRSGDRVVRGGSWFGVPAYVRCAFRFNFDPAFRYVNIGFRLSRAGR